MRRLRWRRSRAAFCKRLGFAKSTANAWETGRRYPVIAIFLAAGRLRGIDVPSQLVAFCGGQLDWKGDDPFTTQGIARFLNAVRGKTPIVELAKRAGISRFSLARWLSGKTQPRLPEFLRTIDAASDRLLDFISLFVDPSEIAVIAETWAEQQRQRAVAYELPWSHAVMRMLELRTYAELPKHEAGWIATRLGIDVEMEAECVAVLAAAGNIRWTGQRWAPTRVLAIDTGRHPEAGRALRRFWAERGLEHIDASDSDDLCAHNLFTVSEQDLERLRDLFRQYFRNRSRRVAASEPAERLVVANLQLFAIDKA